MTVLCLNLIKTKSTFRPIHVSSCTFSHTSAGMGISRLFTPQLGQKGSNQFWGLWISAFSSLCTPPGNLGTAHSWSDIYANDNTTSAVRIKLESPVGPMPSVGVWEHPHWKSCQPFKTTESSCQRCENTVNPIRFRRMCVRPRVNYVELSTGTLWP